jgi:F420-non-reducing hydrogenase iron-sulfur subunit
MTEKSPRILVFSTENVSDPGIDLAGRNKMHYSPSVYVITLPCSSGIRPSWIVHAVENGFDGVFIAADGSDCAYISDCTTRTGKIIADAQNMMRERSIDPSRLKMAAICSVCAEPFEKYMDSFSKQLRKIAAASSSNAE